jgi:[acyl-carrier-protein] S-malonyltransferase
MGKELYDHFPLAKQVFERAVERLGADYVDVIFGGPEEKLRQTCFTQPALFIVSLAALEILKNAGQKFDFAAGHSLGEYSALYSAGAFDFETGLDLVKARGEILQEVSEKVPGAMAAVVGLDKALVEQICRDVSGICEPVNLNCPGQIVIAGQVAAIEQAVVLAQKAGSLKSIKLNVSGAFHSSLMKPAAEKMAEVVARANISDATIPVAMNCDARLTRSSSTIRSNLVTQIDHAVLWQDSMETLFSTGADFFLEVGAGRVLCGLLRRIDKTKKFGNIEDKKSAEALCVASL